MEFDLKNPKINSMNPRTRSVCEGSGTLLVGTRGGEIVEFEMASGSPKVLMRGHFEGEL